MPASAWKLYMAILTCLAALVAVGVLQSPAQALTVANCTGTPMRIQVGRDGSAAKLSSLSASPGATGSISAQASFLSIRLYEKGIVETLRVAAPSIKGDEAYSAVRLSNGQWQLVIGKAC